MALKSTSSLQLAIQVGILTKESRSKIKIRPNPTKYATKPKIPLRVRFTQRRPKKATNI